jgi:hypothetical protein
LDNIYEKPVIKLCPKDRISSIPFDIKNGSTNNHMLFYFIRTTQPCIFSVIYIAPGILSRWQNIQNLFLLSSQLSIIILLEAEYSCCLWWLYEKRTPLLFHNVSFFHNICLLDVMDWNPILVFIQSTTIAVFHNTRIFNSFNYKYRCI